MKIIGAKAHKARLKRMRGPAMVQAVGQAVFVASDLLKTEAKLSISSGSVSGAGHVPSAPGMPPNYDSGHLAGNIENHKTGPLKAEVSSNAEYSAPLEFSSSKMAARPFMKPAADKNRPKAERLVAAAVRRVTR